MSEKAWNTLHSKPKKAVFCNTPGECLAQLWFLSIKLSNLSELFQLLLPDGKFRSNFTIGGLNHFKNFTDATKIESEKINKNREGYYGWMGIGGQSKHSYEKIQIS